LIVGLIISLTSVLVNCAAAAPVQYSGNGHYYEAIYVPSDISWENAKTAAELLSYSGVNGHLATITSLDENEFIVKNINGYNCWLGGIQQAGNLDPAAGWQWVTGEQWDYTNWAGGEPNDNYGGERGVLPYGSPENALEFGGYWNDYPSVVPVDGYIVEYDIIANNKPIAKANGPYTGNEASSVTFDASGSSDPDNDPLIYEWDLNSDGVFEISSSEPTTTHKWEDDYTGTILLKVTDEKGLSDTASTTVTINNVAPTVTVTGNVISENGIATVSGTISDPSSTDTFEVEINWEDGNTETFSYHAGSTEFSETHLYMDDDPSGTSSDDYTVILTVKDDEMDEGTASTTVTVNNVAPVVGVINSPVDPIKIGTVITSDSTFTDAGTLDTHTAVWDWGESPASDGVVTENGGSGTVSGTHTYSSAGIYEIKLTVTDDDTGSDYSVFKYVVVYDPEGGFVTGGGWINSPEGAYVSDTSLIGTANFGFVSKYKKGATVPTGVTQFNFQVADLNFHSDTYDWLVIAGARAQYKGTGTINGEGEYGFMLTAVDGQLNGGGGSDKFRIKIWDKASDAVVYDNMLGADDTDELTTELQGGSITIHKE
jgi:PKD repeat protein